MFFRCIRVQIHSQLELFIGMTAKNFSLGCGVCTLHEIGSRYT
jgi:hypothetical protein